MSMVLKVDNRYGCGVFSSYKLVRTGKDWTIDSVLFNVGRILHDLVLKIFKRKKGGFYFKPEEKEVLFEELLPFLLIL